MIEIVVASPAEVEYSDALRWYADRNLRAAERFDAEFDKSIQMIAAAPDRFPRIDERHRFYLMQRFPYQIIYRSDSMRVTIIAVAHTSREPNYWTGR